MRGSRTHSFISKRITLATALSSLALFGSSVVVAAPVTVVVTSAADVVTSCATTGTADVRTTGCTLRDAIIFSNANPPAPPDQNLIHFNIPGSGVQTITLEDTLPPVTTATAIDGYSQPGATPNTLALGDDAVLLVFVDGSELQGGDAVFGDSS
jgi:CSLREA domain-containing protein